MRAKCKCIRAAQFGNQHDLFHLRAVAGMIFPALS
jgi:hypothetical protein